MHVLNISSLFVVTLLCLGCTAGPLDLTKDQSPVCEIHGVPMAKKSVPIVYVILRPDRRTEAMAEASPHSFPHAQEWINGGCCSSAGSPQAATIYVCAECKKARSKWEQEYGKK